MAEIFISYRRTDYVDGVARTHSVGRLRDRLFAAYGKENVFLDKDSIPPGSIFRDEIMERLSDCKVLLVVIGPHWLDARDEDGRRRLDDPEDWVRTEIELGNRLDLRVVPVLEDDARLPTAEELPESLRFLVGRNAAKLRDDTFDDDFEALTRIIPPPAHLGPPPTVEEPKRFSKTAWIVAAIAAAVVILTVVVVAASSSSDNESTSSNQTDSAQDQVPTDKYSGTGDKLQVLDNFLEPGASIALTCESCAGFEVQALSDTDVLQTLVTTTESPYLSAVIYTGSQPATSLGITTDGNWTIEIAPA